jgi:hypothetical protein
MVKKLPKLISMAMLVGLLVFLYIGLQGEAVLAG